MNLKIEELNYLLTTKDEEVTDNLKKKARGIADDIFGKKIYTRGLIEFTNYCKNNCHYCGIRRENKNAVRYRLNRKEIINCCDNGYQLGFRTFVLQGGEDAYYTDNEVCAIVYSIKEKYPDCAVTLSIGEKKKASYLAFFNAGADRYLLRHETADKKHYERLHPKDMSFENRKRCLYDLKEIGYQTGCGFMVGSPYQTVESIYKDLRFIEDLQPEMVGIGPFIPHKDTEFKNYRAGSLEMTLRLLSIIRIMKPDVLLPATTALGTIHPMGREMGILAGANVVMPNLSPVGVRKKYALYDNKICTGEEAAECRGCLDGRIKSIGYNIVTDRGDYVSIKNKKV